MLEQPQSVISRFKVITRVHDEEEERAAAQANAKARLDDQVGEKK